MEKDDKPIEKPATRVIWFHWRNIRDLAIVAAILVFTWKMWNADLNFNLSEFSFTDLLALILSLFAVWLSVMFYFKADEASSRFYDNSYRFTNEMHVILNRIEAGFGERLRHLDEGYSELRKSLTDRLLNEAEVVEQKAAEVNTIVQSLVAPQAAGEPAPDKDALLADLQRANKELELAKKELKELESLAHNERAARMAYETASKFISVERAGQLDALDVMRGLAASVRQELDTEEGVAVTDRRVAKLFEMNLQKRSIRAVEALRRASYIVGDPPRLSSVGHARLMNEISRIRDEAR